MSEAKNILAASLQDTELHDKPKRRNRDGGRRRLRRLERWRLVLRRFVIQQLRAKLERL
jgi:hypothetical protein